MLPCSRYACLNNVKRYVFTCTFYNLLTMLYRILQAIVYNYIPFSFYDHLYFMIFRVKYSLNFHGTLYRLHRNWCLLCILGRYPISWLHCICTSINSPSRLLSEKCHIPCSGIHTSAIQLSLSSRYRNTPLPLAAECRYVFLLIHKPIQIPRECDSWAGTC